MAARETASLLTGLSVREVGDDVAVRYCGRLFAAMGATVFRRAVLSDARIGYGEELGLAYGRWLDQHKVILEGEDVERLGSVDLVLGGLAADSVGQAARIASAEGPGTVLLSMTWFDPEGPYGGWRGTDELIASLNGTAYSFGEAAGPPMIAQGHAPQVTAGLTAFIPAMAALLQPKGARPARIDVNVFEAAMCFSETAALTGRLGGASVRLGVNRFVPTYPCAPYRTADGWVGVTCLTPAQWSALCGAIDRPELALEPRFSAAYQRLMHSVEVDAALAPAIARRPSAAWVQLGIEKRIPITPMRRPGSLPEEAHWQGRDAFEPLDGSAVLAPSLPFRMDFDGRPSRASWGGGASAGLLAGLRVADFSMGWAGPLCARTLADLGADVVKIESQSHPDWWRGWEAGSVDPASRELHHNFIDVNRNKRGVDWDLASPSGRDQAAALIAESDVVVENFAAGVLEKLGLGVRSQRALRPGVVSVSMPAFGNGGPLSALRAYGSTVEQASGLPFINGEPDWAPAQQHIAFGDPIAGLYAAAGVLAALHARERRGGAFIDLSQVACLFQLGADAIIAEQRLGAPAPRTGHSRRRAPLCAVVRAHGADAWLTVVAQDETDLAALSRVTGGEGVEALAIWAGAMAAPIAAARLQQAGVPAAPVQPAHGLTRDPQLNAGGFWAEMERQYVGAHLVAGSPFRFDGERPELRRPAPLLGEHNDEVLQTLRAST
jgi:crotonobetainyl-CoA:carnitine CoA-transferase CaiB-like acyl-CoA transferase